MFENRVLSRIFAPNIIIVITSRRMRWAGHGREDKA
jgi:hypothetical protein